MSFEGFGVLPSYDEPLESDLLLRQSDIDSMMLCPARKGLARHPDYDSTPTEPMFFGSVEHAVIDKRITEGESLQLRSPAWVAEFARDLAISDGFELDRVLSPTGIKNFATEICQAYDAWELQWFRFKTFNPIITEERIVRPLGTLPNGRGVWVHGTPDVLDAEGMIDWKTAGSGWKPGKGEVRIQTPTYLWLGEAHRGQLEGRGLYVVYDRSRAEWSEFPVHIRMETINAALLTLWEYGRMIDADVYPPTPSAPSGANGRGWWCSVTYCNAWDICPYKALVADDRNLTEVRIRTWAA